MGWTSYAVDMRYDITGYPDKEEMLHALKTAQELRSAVLALIPTQTEPPESATE